MIICSIYFLSNPYYCCVYVFFTEWIGHFNHPVGLWWGCKPQEYSQFSVLPQVIRIPLFKFRYFFPRSRPDTRFSTVRTLLDRRYPREQEVAMIARIYHFFASLSCLSILAWSETFFNPNIREEASQVKCLLKYQWVKLPRNQMPPGKGIMGAWARLASRAANWFCS